MGTSKAMLSRILGYFLLMFVISITSGNDFNCVSNGVSVIDATIYPKGNIYSPGYSENENYPNFASCSYRIETYRGWHIRFKFNHFDIERSVSCDSDQVVIYDFQNRTGRVSRILCGDNIPRDIVSKSDMIQLRFRSNHFNTKKGFNITFLSQSSSAVCPSGSIECKNRNCVSNSLECNGKDECGDGTDEEGCGLPSVVSECGNPAITPLSSFDRIVGGKEALHGSWPWMADLQLSNVEPNGHSCGGTLINAQWVLTAAHCFEDEGSRSAKNWRVHLGNHDKFTIEPNEQIRYVERLIIYDDIPPQEFESNGKYDATHDVALLKLNAPVSITTYVRPVCLPSAGEELKPHTDCYTTGWGYTRGTGSSDYLKQAHHPIQPDTICRNIVQSNFQATTMICAGSMGPLNGVCHGDSGGPLVCKKTDNKWHLFGVTGAVTANNIISGLCGLKDHPSIFSKVSAKIPWITRIINKYT